MKSETMFEVLNYIDVEIDVVMDKKLLEIIAYGTDDDFHVEIGGEATPRQLINISPVAMGLLIDSVTETIAGLGVPTTKENVLKALTNSVKNNWVKEEGIEDTEVENE